MDESRNRNFSVEISRIDVILTGHEVQLCGLCFGYCQVQGHLTEWNVCFVTVDHFDIEVNRTVETTAKFIQLSFQFGRYS